MTQRDETIRRTKQRVGELIKGFDAYCDAFDTILLFTGPSVYFHHKTLSLLSQCSSVAEAVRDQAFLESLYATLTAWGLHRMGPGGAKLVDFPTMADSFRAMAQQITDLSAFRLCQLTSEQVKLVRERLWDVMLGLKVGAGEARIVSGSKALHHVLPELVPPIDREYTIRFFFHNKNLYQGEDVAFREMFSHFNQIASQCQDKIRERVGRGLHTSSTKVIDNAIVGYVRRHLKSEVA